jgi:hypothetical protein
VNTRNRPLWKAVLAQLASSAVPADGGYLFDLHGRWRQQPRPSHGEGVARTASGNVVAPLRRLGVAQWGAEPGLPYRSADLSDGSMTLKALECCAGGRPF